MKAVKARANETLRSFFEKSTFYGRVRVSASPGCQHHMGKNPLEIRSSSLGHPYFSHINGSYQKEINEGAIDI